MSRRLDRFYTKKEVAVHCWNVFRDIAGDFKCYIEPGAGDGVFLELLPAGRRYGFDLEPRHPEITRRDFLNWTPVSGSIATIGNPPFGKNSSLAVKFLNHAMTFSQAIGFILPRTFRKPGFIHKNIKNVHWHVMHESILEKDSFRTPDGSPYDVPCAFQIWMPRNEPREYDNRPLAHPDFEFVRKQDADFSFQRVGVNAGRIRYEFADVSPNSHYFIKAKTPGVIEALTAINWDCKQDTAGNPSISKAELVAAYSVSE